MCTWPGTQLRAAESDGELEGEGTNPMKERVLGSD